MTGFGEARLQDSRWTIRVELRTVNNRHFKLAAKISDEFAMMEPALEHLVRERVRRGSVQVSLRIDRPRRPEDYRLNLVALASYRDQLREFQDAGPGPGRPALDLSPLLALPGVVEEIRAPERAADEDWPEVARVVGQALDALQASRAEEGRAMAAELSALGRSIAEQLGRIADRAPTVVEGYQKRLTERVQSLVRDQGVTIQPGDLVREVAVFADRSDISEELVRLRAHLGQYAGIIEEPESSGRKLEFVIQEMGREINTIGSKANDVEISRGVVEVKSLLERIRELVQNVE
jgi:uncharacterized protein (TIGR00255 family)